MVDFPERDWKLFKELHAMASERFCARALRVIKALMEDTTKDSIDRFFELKKLVQVQEREWNVVFSDWRRSTAALQLGAMFCRDLLTSEEFDRLSPYTRDYILRMAQVMNPKGKEGREKTGGSPDASNG
jgi:hypothetical protein